MKKHLLSMFTIATLVMAFHSFSLEAYAQSANTTEKKKSLPKKIKKSIETSSSTSDTATSSVVPVDDNVPVSEVKSFNGQEVFQFNTDAVPQKTSDRDMIKFKVPTDEKSLADIKNVNPVETEKNEMPFKTYIGYPKQQINISYAPTNYGGKFTYNGTDFNFSSTSLMALNANYRFLSTPSVFFEADLNYFTASSKSGNPNPYAVVDSSVGTYNLFFRGNYCFIGDNFFAKLCPGAELGLDSYPLLGFKNNSTLEMQKATEISYGLNLFAQYPLIGSTLLQARLGYLMGSGAGQSGELTSKKNNAYYLNTQVNWPIAKTTEMNAGINYLVRTSTVEGKKGASSDKWDTNVGQLALRVGVTFNL